MEDRAKEEGERMKIIRNKWLCRFFWVIPLVALLLGTGCRKGEKEEETGGEKVLFGMSQCNLAEPWRVQMNDDVRNQAMTYPEIKLLEKDAQNDVTVQQSQVLEFLTQGIDLLIVSPKETVPMTAPVKEVYDAGIPVIVLDREIQGTSFTCFIGGDNVLIGREAGKHLASLLKGKGNVVELMGLMTSEPGVDRHEGFVQGLKEYAREQGTDPDGIKTVFSADCQWLEENGRREMSSALARFDKIDAVYAHNDPQAHGAYLAAKAEGRGREKTIKFIGIDALPHEGVMYVKQGILTATFQYPTGGKEAVDIGMKILQGEQVPKWITLGTRLFTKENVDKGGMEIPAKGPKRAGLKPDKARPSEKLKKLMQK
jgi:ribose transport system substrate-binding protein